VSCSSHAEVGTQAELLSRLGFFVASACGAARRRKVDAGVGWAKERVRHPLNYTEERLGG